MVFAPQPSLPFDPNRKDWAIITATQGALGAHNNPLNTERQGALRAALASLKVPFIAAQGFYEGVDQGESLLILGITERAATGLGWLLNQQTILTHKGLVSCVTGYVLAQRDPENDVTGPAAREKEGYTQFANGVCWSAGI